MRRNDCWFASSSWFLTTSVFVLPVYMGLGVLGLSLFAFLSGVRASSWVVWLQGRDLLRLRLDRLPDQVVPDYWVEYQQFWYSLPSHFHWWISESSCWTTVSDIVSSRLELISSLLTAHKGRQAGVSAGHLDLHCMTIPNAER